mmetsp:Transcript_73916/g.130583  ORF Transcript_73916/g.130583 Transcript_73916/m.130583 type:complete len:263 (+) Transcript_73916:755-1543(+)
MRGLKMLRSWIRSEKANEHAAIDHFYIEIALKLGTSRARESFSNLGHRSKTTSVFDKPCDVLDEGVVPRRLCLSRRKSRRSSLEFALGSALASALASAFASTFLSEWSRQGSWPPFLCRAHWPGRWCNISPQRHIEVLPVDLSNLEVWLELLPLDARTASEYIHQRQSTSLRGFDGIRDGLYLIFHEIRQLRFCRHSLSVEHDFTSDCGHTWYSNFPLAVLPNFVQLEAIFKLGSLQSGEELTKFSQRKNTLVIIQCLSDFL